MINPMLGSPYMSNPLAALSNIDNLLTQFQSFKQNPTQFMLQRNIPQEVLQNPAGVAQQLLNSGRLTQAQFNQLQQVATQLNSDPRFANLFKQ